MEKKDRKQLSPEALEKLALAREKALQTRLRNKVLREQSMTELPKDVEKEQEPEPEPESEPVKKPEPEIDVKPKPKKNVPDTDDEEKEVAKVKKVKKKPNRSKIIISNDSSSSDDDDTPVVYIKTKKKNKPKQKPVVEEHQEVIQEYQNNYIQEVPAPIVRQETNQLYQKPTIRRPSWM